MGYISVYKIEKIVKNYKLALIIDDDDDLCQMLKTILGSSFDNVQYTHNLKMGKTEIEPSTPPTVLHAQLRQEGWKEDSMEECLECGASTFVLLDKLILLGPVETTSEGDEL